MDLCADAYRVDTTNTEYTTQGKNVDIYDGKPFEVRVANAYQGKVIHVQLSDHSVYFQDLDAPAYTAPFTFVNKASDALATTYLVKITQP
jgi:hypothetical protein